MPSKKRGRETKKFTKKDELNSRKAKFKKKLLEINSYSQVKHKDILEKKLFLILKMQCYLSVRLIQ